MNFILFSPIFTVKSDIKSSFIIIIIIIKVNSGN